MAANTRTTTTNRTPMTPLRKTALIAGVLYLTTFVASIPVKFGLYDDVLNNPNFVLGAGSDRGVLWGALLEVICGLACIGTAVTLYPVARRQSERGALGFVTARVLEASMIFVGIVSVLSVFTLRNDFGTSGGDSGSLLSVGHSLVAVHDWTFLVGPGVIAAVNALLLGSVMYRSGLVPRVIPKIGLIGAPILLASCMATLFGAYDQVSSWAALGAFPVAIWELSLGGWMAFKGFKPSPITDGAVTDTAAPLGVAA